MEQIEDVIGILLMVIIIQIVIFLLIREIVMWYWKVNKRIQLQEKTNLLLQQILDRININPESDSLSSIPKLNQLHNKSLNEIIREQKEQKS